MAPMTTSHIDALRGTVRGAVFGPSDQGYDEARTVWNGLIDKRPAVVVRCANADDVSAAIQFARDRDLELAVRGGAHGTAGNATVDDGLMIDLSQMRQTVVDPVTRTGLVGGGATLAERDKATQEHGLAVTAGIVGHTGVAGLTLGGGMGWLTRRHGLALDNLLSAEVVGADGRIVRASAQDDPDLFWAIRGGGGNFGVVTEFEFRLHPVGPLVDFGMFFWPLEQGADALRLNRELLAEPSADVNVILAGINAPPAPFVPEEHQGEPGYAMLVTGFGPTTRHAAVADRIRRELPPLFEMVTPIPYAELQQMFDEANRFGLLAYDKALYLEDLTDDVVSVISEQIPRKTSPLSPFFLYRLDGAYCDVADEDTAFGGLRSPRYVAFMIGLADNPEMFEADKAWVRSFWDALVPYASGIGSYVNGEFEIPEDRLRASFGVDKYERLATLKAQYDPDNVFHRNANIPPAGPRPPTQRKPVD
ncbi:MAG TPA: FAD-binding oxidoreductase [Nocardioidaceae bacterium]|nr:FAD-binding oxidoreductase [Nocardioidaceae bacterium]